MFLPAQNKWSESHEDVLQKIQQKRAQIEQYVSREFPRKRKLVNLTIMGGTLSAALTAVPAVGGQPVTAWLTQTFGLVSAVTGQHCQANPWPYPAGATDAPGSEQPDTAQNDEYGLGGD